MNMDTNSGLCWHVHHDVLVEFCYDIAGREKYIRDHKPEREKEPRLRLFNRVRGKIPAEWNAARDEWDKARAEWNAARDEWDKARAKYSKEIEALHTIECPDCPWNGSTIFP